jgi:hypothetical protein
LAPLSARFSGQAQALRPVLTQRSNMIKLMKITFIFVRFAEIARAAYLCKNPLLKQVSFGTVEHAKD